MILRRLEVNRCSLIGRKQRKQANEDGMISLVDYEQLADVIIFLLFTICLFILLSVC